MRRWLLKRANHALAPGRLEAASFQFSWFRPTVIEGFGLRNAQGHAILATSRAVWDRNLFRILFDRPRYGTLRLDGARIDIERLQDGKIDLAETLRPVLDGPDETDLSIEIKGGTLRLRGKGLLEPIRAETFNLRVHRPPSPLASQWALTLSNGAEQSLAVDGSYDRRDNTRDLRKELEFHVEARGWPLAIGSDQLGARADIWGSMRGEIDGELFASSGELFTSNPVASGAFLRGDTIDLGPSRASWDVSRDAAGWSIRVLQAKTSLGNITAGGKPTKLIGRFDIAALSRQTRHLLGLRDDFRLDRGTADLDIVAMTRDNRPGWAVEVKLVGLAGRAGDRSLALRQPAAVHAQVVDTKDGPRLASLSLRSTFLTAEGRGSDAETTITGTIDLAGLHREFGDMIDFRGYEPGGKGRFSAVYRPGGAETAANLAIDFDALSFGLGDGAIGVGATRVQASSRGDWLRSPGDASWKFGLDVASLQGPGISAGAVRIAARKHQGRVAIEPISTTLNGGTLKLVPELVNAPGGLVLRLNSGSSLEHVEVNEVLTSRVLSFVAPILEGATRAHGYVSARIDRADFPMDSRVASKAVVEGQVIFRDLEFGPGPLASDLVRLAGRGDPTLKLDQPVVLSIADGRIRQKGLAIPLGDLTRIELEGTVGFDRTLDLRASLPLTAAMFPDRPLVGDLIGGTRLTLPIGGTLSRPKIDREAFGDAMAGAGRELLGKGAAGLLNRLLQPREQPAVPRPSAEERRERRKDARARRRGEMP